MRDGIFVDRFESEGMEGKEGRERGSIVPDCLVLAVFFLCCLGGILV